MDEKSHKNVFVYDILYKTLIGAKPLRIRFDKVDGFIRVYDGTRYLDQKHDFINIKIRYFTGIKGRITYVFPHNYAKIKVDSFDSLPLERPFAFHNVITYIKSVWNKDQNHYYYNIF